MFPRIANLAHPYQKLRRYDRPFGRHNIRGLCFPGMEIYGRGSGHPFDSRLFGNRCVSEAFRFYHVSDFQRYSKIFYRR